MTAAHPSFSAEFRRIAVPVTAQSVIMALVLLTDQLMVGQLGEVAVASVGIGAKITAIVTVPLTGLATGVSVFAAQHWGTARHDRVRQLLGLGLRVGAVFTLAVTVMVAVFPSLCMAPFTTDERVLTDGADFVRIVTLGYIPTMLTLVYSAVLRSTGSVRLPLLASVAAAVVNLGLDWLLIFGRWGLPTLGLTGAAVSTTTARIIEIAIIIVGVYATRHVAAVRRVRDLGGVTPALLRNFGVVALPLAVNELIWILGESVYVVVYGRMGTGSLAAVALTFPLQSLAIAFMTGIAGAASVLVGQRLGRDDLDDARRRSRQLVATGISAGVAVGGLLALTSTLYVGLYDVPADVRALGKWCTVVFGLYLWVKVANMILAGAVLQAGGDSRFVLLMESLATWCVGVPLAVFAAVVLDLPVWAVFAVLSAEEVLRLALGWARFQTSRWMRNLTTDPTAQAPA